MAIYSGFSTHNRRKKFHVHDFDLVKQDIFNHFNIRRGEKLMNPNFGTVIWGMIFEPLSEETRELIIEDVKRICTYDPRVVTNSIRLVEYEHGIQIEIELTYLTDDLTEKMVVTFDNTTRTALANI